MPIVEHFVDLRLFLRRQRSVRSAGSKQEQQSETELLAAGITPDYIRVSVGLEDVKDILADLDQALAASQTP